MKSVFLSLILSLIIFSCKTAPVREPTPSDPKEILAIAKTAEKKGDYDLAISFYQKLAHVPSPEVDEGDQDYQDIAAEGLITLECRKKKGKDYETGKKREIQDAVIHAFETQDEKELFKFASCGFAVGAPYSHIDGVLDPEKAVPILLRALKEIKWKKQRQDFGNQFIVDSKSEFEGEGPSEYELMFRKGENGWRWFGFATSNGNLLGKLLSK